MSVNSVSRSDRIGKYKDTVIFYRHYNQICIKSYAVPKNPRSVLQQMNRMRFRFISFVGQAVNDLILREYWAHLDAQGIGFNAFQRVNMNFVDYELQIENIVMTGGTYEPVNDVIFVRYKDTNDRAMFKWSTVITGRGSPDDKILLVLIDLSLYQPAQELFTVRAWINSEKVRSDSVGFILPDQDLDAQYLHGFVSAISQDQIGINTISVSHYKKVDPM